MLVQALSLPLVLLPSVVIAHTHGNLPRPHHVARHGQLANRGRGAFDAELAPRQNSGVIGGLLDPNAESSAGQSSVAGTSAVVTTRPPLSPTARPTATSRPVTPTSASDDDDDNIASSLSASASPTGSASSVRPTMINGTSILSHSSSNVSSATISSSASAVSSASEAESSQITSISTNAEGSAVVVIKTLTASASASEANSSDAASTGDDKKKDDDKGISTGAIIGIAVGAGVAIILLIACAVWRMRRRGHDEDEAIRWPELNRHGDSTVHHALPARQTGQHGIETNPLERSLSTSSSLFAASTMPPPSAHSAAPMALNGSAFGAASSLEDYNYNEKMSPPLPIEEPQRSAGHTPTGYGHDDDYANMPPQVQMQAMPVLGYNGYDSETDDTRGPQMGMAPGAHGVSQYQGRP